MNEKDEQELNEYIDVLIMTIDELEYPCVAIEVVRGYCATCNRLSVDPASFLSLDEEKEIVNRMRESILNLKDGITRDIISISPDMAGLTRGCRSGLQFLFDHLAPLDEKLQKYIQEEIIESNELRILDEKLRREHHLSGEWETLDNYPADLRGHPATHIWWNERERFDSIRFFGNG